MSSILNRISILIRRSKKSSFVSVPAPESKPISMGYPRWKLLVPEYPSHGQFLLAWKVVFEEDLYNCKVTDIFQDGENAGFNIITPTKLISHGGFGHYTECPVVDDFYYKGGIPWYTDKNNERFYYIDQKSGLPVDWERVYSIEVIRRYLMQHGAKTALLH